MSMNYHYIANDLKTGKRVSSYAMAESADDLVMSLHSKGLLPLKVRTCTWTYSLDSLFKPRERVKSKELTIFTRQLGATLNSGLLLTDALDTMGEDMENKFFQGIIIKIRNDIVAGSSFSTALMKYPKVFPLSYCQVVKSGEVSGRLNTTITDLAQYLEKSERIKEKVVSAMRYPSFILIFALLVLSAIVLLLIPKFKDIYGEIDTKLPLLTQMLISVSDFAVHNLVWIIAVVVLAVWGIVRLLKRNEFQETIDNVKLKIPLLGRDVLHKSIVSNFCRTLGFLVSAGVEISASLEIAADVVSHAGFKKTINQVRKRVITGGASISTAIREQKLFPRMVSKMLLVGEKSGRLPEMLKRTADYYDEEVEHTIHGLLVLIEPALIAAVGGLVGLVVVALYLPIFKLATVIK